jgi:regulator of replication initiation timing
MNTDILTIYAPDLLTAAIAVVSVTFAIATGVLTNSLRTRNKELDAAVERHNSLRDELTQTVAQQSAAEKAVVRWERTAKEMESDRDSWKRRAGNFKQTMRAAMDENDRLLTERATLYFRNALGQIEPITPKERKPHTLKHGMTVKDPTEAQAKRIFREAKKAGIHLEPLNDDAELVSIVFSSSETNLAAKDALLILGVYVSEATYITAHEFLRRIKGEIV